ncbi:MAG: hypothetical protein QG647_92 [Patescibacteria group bacterium]|nr:hypothetical protein [Patescibacteria group bacterium]
MNKIKRILSTLAILAVSIAPVSLVASSSVLAADLNTGGYACGGSGASQYTAESCDTNGSKLPAVLTNIINIFSWIVGIVSVIMIIYGGFRYITSGGDSNGVTAAKNTILYAIIGLVIVALAQVIVQFVLTKANSAATPTS